MRVTSSRSSTRAIMPVPPASSVASIADRSALATPPPAGAAVGAAAGKVGAAVAVVAAPAARRNEHRGGAKHQAQHGQSSSSYHRRPLRPLSSDTLLPDVNRPLGPYADRPDRLPVLDPRGSSWPCPPPTEAWRSPPAASSPRGRALVLAAQPPWTRPTAATVRGLAGPYGIQPKKALKRVLGSSAAVNALRLWGAPQGPPRTASFAGGLRDPGDRPRRGGARPLLVAVDESGVCGYVAWMRTLPPPSVTGAARLPICLTTWLLPLRIAMAYASVWRGDVRSPSKLSTVNM
jgi:hypothetical protein